MAGSRRFRAEGPGRMPFAVWLLVVLRVVLVVMGMSVGWVDT